MIIAFMAAAGFLAVMVWKSAHQREQRKNMAAADRHIPLLLPVLAKESRFADIELSAYTSSNGCLLVRGEVDSGDDLEALNKIVKASHPPVEVVYMVMVITPEMKALMKRREASQVPRS
jgi:hypothetical protein